jgi:hypothetical protein
VDIKAVMSSRGVHLTINNVCPSSHSPNRKGERKRVGQNRESERREREKKEGERQRERERERERESIVE